MIKPTVGRVLWYWPNGVTIVWAYNAKANGTDPVDQPCSAQVTYVHRDRMVNVRVAGHNGDEVGMCSVPLVQEGDDIPAAGEHFCTWMPWQMGQAVGRATNGLSNAPMVPPAGLYNAAMVPPPGAPIINVTVDHSAAEQLRKP